MSYFVILTLKSYHTDLTIMEQTLKRHGRVDVADVLRGFAVLAIVLLHSIEHFNFYSFPDPSTQPTWLNFTDKAIWDGLFFMFGGKAYAIFAILFGFSFFIQDDNQRMRGDDFRLRFCWRLLLLFVIGQFNAAFFTGEILVMYSLIGFVLVLTCRMSNRSVVFLASVCLLQPYAIYQLLRSLIDPGFDPVAIDTAGFWKATFSMQDGGTFLDTVRVNLWEGQLASLAWAWDHGRIFQTASLFMFGMLIGREGWFLRGNLCKWSIVFPVALMSFFPLYGLHNMIGNYVTDVRLLTPMKLILSSLANVSFMLILLCGVLFGYYCTVRFSRVLSLLIPYGRMSMTNYVTQGIIGAAMFYNWGLHLRIGITGSVLIGIVIFLAQYSICRIWFRNHNHGQLEYLWKKATWIKFPWREK